MRHQYGYRWGWWGPGGWTWFWGVALVLVGCYYLLKNLGLLDWVKGDLVWPLLIILLGLWMIVARALR